MSRGNIMLFINHHFPMNLPTKSLDKITGHTHFVDFHSTGRPRSRGLRQSCVGLVTKDDAAPEPEIFI